MAMPVYVYWRLCMRFNIIAYATIWGYLASIVMGALLAAVVGFVVGLPTLRLRGDYLAIATLGMSEIIKLYLLI